jgi:hypothetical protein
MGPCLLLLVTLMAFEPFPYVITGRSRAMKREQSGADPAIDGYSIPAPPGNAFLAGSVTPA